MNTAIYNLCSGDWFLFKGDNTLYIYMGTYSHSRISYFLYRDHTGKPYIMKYDDTLEVKIIE